MCVGWTAEAVNVACMRFYGLFGRDQGGEPVYNHHDHNHNHNNNDNQHQKRSKGQKSKNKRGGKNNRKRGKTANNFNSFNTNGNANLVSAQCSGESLGHSEPTFEFTGECSEITYEPTVDSQADALFDPVCEEHTGDSRDSMDSVDYFDSVDTSSETQGTSYSVEYVDQWADLFAHFARLSPNNFVENPNCWNRCTVHNRIAWEPDVLI